MHEILEKDKQGTTGANYLLEVNPVSIWGLTGYLS